MVLETNKLYHKSSSRGFLRLELSKWVQIMANLQALQIFTFRFIVHLLDSSLKIKYNTLLDWYKTGENWNNVSFHSVVTKENSECSRLTCFILIGCDGVSFINPGILSNLNWRLWSTFCENYFIIWKMKLCKTVTSNLFSQGHQS